MTRKNKARLGVYSLAFVAYLMLFWGVGCADFFILHPSRSAIEVSNGRRVMIEAGGSQVEVWTGRTRVRSDGGRGGDLAIVLDFPPNAGRAEYSLMYGIGRWEGLPVGYWAVNYPGYGGSEGRATLDGVHRSALAAYDELALQHPGVPVFVSGYSLGTTAALHVAANRPVAGVILHAPPPLRELITRKHGWWNLWLLAWPVSRDVPSELDSLANAAKSKAPAVFLVSELDTLVDAKYQRLVIDAYAGEKTVVSMRANHNDDVDAAYGREIRQAVQDLWRRTMQGGATTGPTTQP